jgi:hypothetical protein
MNHSTYTPSVIRDLESAGYYETLMCWSCKALHLFIPDDGRCNKDVAGERCDGRVIVVPF